MNQRLLSDVISELHPGADCMADDTMGIVLEALRSEFENRHLVLKQRMQLLEKKVADLTELIK